MKNILFVFFHLISFSGLAQSQGADIPAAPTPEFSWFSTRLAVETQCQETQDLHILLNRYVETLRSGQPIAKVKLDLLTLKNRVGEIAKTNSVCRKAALSNYLLESTYLLTSGINDRASITDRRGPFSMGWTYLALAALNQGHVSFTTGEKQTRVGHDHQVHQILGSYNCMRSEIEINPLLSPFDLAATVVHEMNHLVADRWNGHNYNVYHDMDQKYRRRELRLAVTPRIILMEEAASAVIAGYLEHSFLAQNLSSDRQKESWGDLTMFSRSGVLAVSSSKKVLMNYEGQRPIDWGFEKIKALASDTRPVAQSHEFETKDLDVLRRGRTVIADYPAAVLAETLLTGNTYRVSQLARPEADRFMQKLLSTISLPYFGKSVSSESVRLLQEAQIDNFRGGGFPGGIPWGMKPISRPRYNSILTWWTFAPDEVLTLAASPEVKLFDSASGIRSAFYGNDMPWTIEAVNRVLSYKVVGPTDVCKEFSRRAEAKELGGYLGQGKRGKRPGTDGIRPGTDGVRPNTDGIKPCVQITEQI